MNQETIALVFMADDTRSFFIEGPPFGPPEKWIKQFVAHVAEVEYVEVFELGSRAHFWCNPNVCPENEF
jgi:hypothetical protein